MIKTFRFYSAIIISIFLGILGFILASIFPILNHPILVSKLLYSLLGILVGILTFGPITAWLLRTSARLTRQITSRLASEIAEQFAQIGSRNLLKFPIGLNRDIEVSDLGQLKIKNFSKAGAIVLDTSSIIDGRVLEVARSGFLKGVVVIADFVLLELQQVADSSDALKRARGRQGFEIINSLKKVPGIKIIVWDKEVKGKLVDDRVVELAKKLNARILTCDFNLNKVAKIKGVEVLNMNELANALKTKAIPGEKFDVKLIHPGKDNHQGVGYLNDGTMVVVQEGSEDIGKVISVEATKILQNPSGWIIFSKKTLA